MSIALNIYFFHESERESTTLFSANPSTTHYPYVIDVISFLNFFPGTCIQKDFSSPPWLNGSLIERVHNFFLSTGK